MSKNKNCISRDNKIAHLSTSAWIVNYERTKVLMIYHNIYNSWAWIGGHADNEPNLYQVIKREITEETGMENSRPLMGENIYGLSIVPVIGHTKRGQIVNPHLHLDV